MKRVGMSLLSALLFCIVFIFASVQGSFAAQDTDLQKMLLRLKPGVVLILSNCTAKVEVDTPEGRRVFDADPIGSGGTGFLLSPDGYLVTNGHVVEMYHESNEKQLKKQFFINVLMKYLVPIQDNNGRRLTDQERQEFVSKNIAYYLKIWRTAKLVIEKKLHVILSNGEPFAAEIKEYSPPLTAQPGKTAVAIFEEEEKVETGKDVAILKIEGRDLPIVKLGDSGNLQLGEPLYIIGYPGVVMSHQYLNQKTALDSTVTSGHVSGSKLDVKGTPVIQTDAALTWGNSGGPAFNANGEVIGIATFISISQAGGTSQAIQGFNFLVPINTAKEFIRASGAELNVESLFNKLWNEALELYSKPDYSKALSKIDEVNRIIPNQPDVRKLQLAAQEKLSSQKGGIPMLPILSAVLGVLIIGGIVLFVMLQKKGKKTPAPEAATAPPLQQTRVTAPPASLKCTEGSLAGRSFPITPAGLKIGRDPVKNQAVVDNDGVSREHAWVGIENGKMIVKDLNSLNGTYLNSTDNDRIKSEPLKNGDTIIIGKGRFASFTFSEG